MTDDILRRIMEAQEEFQTRVKGGVSTYVWYNDPDQLMDAIRTQALAAIKELGEALDECGWKPWATSKHFNIKPFRSELIDALRFWMNLAIIADMTPGMIETMYMESLAKTDNRIVNGYDGVKDKCPRCKRSYADKIQCHPPTKDKHGWCQLMYTVVEDEEFEPPSDEE